MGVFNPNTDQIVDTEETAVVDHLQGNLPESEAVWLIDKQSVQEVEAARVSFFSIENPQILVDKLLYCRASPDTAAIDFF